MTARITYNSKTIDLHVTSFNVDAAVARTVNRTLTGDTETIFLPRMDVHVQASFQKSTSASLRLSFHEFWQWAQKGNQFRFVLDTTKTVKTTLSGAEAAGQTVLSVTSTAGFVSGQNYVVIEGPNYQLVNISSIGAGTITIGSSLNFDFANGAVVRDEYLWDAILIDPSLPCPIRDLFDPERRGTWDASLDCFEDVA